MCIRDSGKNPLTADTIRLSEEVTDQITALKDMVKMAAMYGYDSTRPAENLSLIHISTSFTAATFPLKPKLIA